MGVLPDPLEWHTDLRLVDKLKLLDAPLEHRCWSHFDRSCSTCETEIISRSFHQQSLVFFGSIVELNLRLWLCDHLVFEFARLRGHCVIPVLNPHLIWVSELLRRVRDLLDRVLFEHARLVCVELDSDLLRRAAVHVNFLRLESQVRVLGWEFKDHVIGTLIGNSESLGRHVGSPHWEISEFYQVVVVSLETLE